jgi:hypothetical protein
MMPMAKVSAAIIVLIRISLEYGVEAAGGA